MASKERKQIQNGGDQSWIEAWSFPANRSRIGTSVLQEGVRTENWAPARNWAVKWPSVKKDQKYVVHKPSVVMSKLTITQDHSKKKKYFLMKLKLKPALYLGVQKPKGKKLAWKPCTENYKTLLK